MKVFVTGGTGFIGTRVVRRLIHAHHQPRCLVRGTSNTGELIGMGVTLFTGDVTEKTSLLEGMGGCDWVVNLASVYSWWEPDKRVYSDVNIEGTRNVMESALETGVAKVAHVSTSYIYGKPDVAPFTEETPVGPVRPSAYAQTKHAGDSIAWHLYEERKLPLVVLYPGGVLGAGDPKLTGRYIKRFLTGRVPRLAFTDSILTYVHVGDVADAIVLALEKEGNIGEKYLIGKYALSLQQFNRLISEISGAALPPTASGAVVLLTSTLATWLADLTKSRPKLPAIDLMRSTRDGCWFDGSKAERELGLAYTPIRESLEEAIESLA